MVRTLFSQQIISHDGQKTHLSRWGFLPSFPAVGMTIRFDRHFATVKSFTYHVDKEYMHVHFEKVDGTHDFAGLLIEMSTAGFVPSATLEEP